MVLVVIWSIPPVSPFRLAVASALTVTAQPLGAERQEAEGAPPLLSSPSRGRFQAAAGFTFVGRLNLLLQSIAWAPGGSSPWAAQRHKATNNLRASATMPILRMRALPAAKRW